MTSNVDTIMGAKGAGNPIGFMGSLSDTHISSNYWNRGAEVATMWKNNNNLKKIKNKKKKIKKWR